MCLTHGGVRSAGASATRASFQICRIFCPLSAPRGVGRVSRGSPGLTRDCSFVSGSLGRAILLSLSPNTCERSAPPALSVHGEYGVQDRCPGFLGSPSATTGTKQKNGKGNFPRRKRWRMFTKCSSWEHGGQLFLSRRLHHVIGNRAWVDPEGRYCQLGDLF